MTSQEHLTWISQHTRMTQVQLAALCGISQSQICKILNGTRPRERYYRVIQDLYFHYQQELELRRE